MICKICNSNIADGSLFCPVCGSKQEPASAFHTPMSSDLGWGVPGDLDAEQPAQPWNTPAPQETPQPHWSDATTVLNENPYQQPRTPYYAPVGYGQPDVSAPVTPCPQCGKNMARRPLGAQSCEFCGWNDFRPPYRAPEAPAPKPKSGKLIGVIAGAAVAVLVLIVVLVGVFTNWFGLTGPAMTVANAAKNTLTAENLTVEFTIDEGYESIEGTAYIDMDLDKRILNLLLELEVDGETGELVIYDEYLILHSEGYYQYMDISDELDEFFDACEQTGSGEIDWEEIFVEWDIDQDDDLERIIDFDKINDCLTAYAKKLNDPNWLKTYAGYSTDQKNGVTRYILEPELAVFLPASAVYFEDAFYDRDVYEDIMDETEDLEELDDELQIMVAFGVKSGKLVSVETEIEVYGEDATVEVTFSDIGSTKLDLDELADMLEEAKDSTK